MSAVIEAIHDLIGPCQERSDKHTSRAFQVRYTYALSAITSSSLPPSYFIRKFFIYFQKLDLNSDGVITMDEFMACCFNVSKIFSNFIILAKN